MGEGAPVPVVWWVVDSGLLARRSPEVRSLWGRRWKVGNTSAIGAAPDTQHAVLTTRHDELSIRGGGGGINIVSGPGKCPDVVAIFADQTELIIARRGQGLIGGINEGNGSNFLGEAFDVLFSL